MVGWPRPVCFVNGRVLTPEGVASSVRFRSTVLAIDDTPHRGDAIVDLQGAFVLPGLINAHDHLELNHYGQLKRRERYENASAWIDDMRAALGDNQSIRRNQAYPLADRLFIGGLKNVLAGVTTVAHHNPWYRAIGHVPVRVVKRYGWAHSLGLERQPVGARGEPGGSVSKRCADTPASFPFIVHAAEGVDEAAAREVRQLEALGCLRPNTVLVHGLALTLDMWRLVRAAGTSLVWCPASNRFLFGRTICARSFLDAADGAWSRLALGSDSRVTGARDLLDEMRVAAEASPVSPRELLRMVTTVPARVLQLRDAGRIAVGSPADLLVVRGNHDDAASVLLATRRRDVSLVTLGGRPLVGEPGFASVFAARRTPSRAIAVDGVRRLAEAGLARRVERSSISEPGVECLS